MSDSNLELSPLLKNLASEGGLDTAILNGNSIQRTLNMVDYDGKKIVSKKDGEVITVSDGGEYLAQIIPSEFVEARGDCSNSETLCDSVCVNLTNDESNCGSCGNACPAGYTCVSGVCMAPTPTPTPTRTVTPTPTRTVTPTPTRSTPTPTPTHA